MKNSSAKSILLTVSVITLVLIAGYVYLYFDFQAQNQTVIDSSDSVARQAAIEKRIVVLRSKVEEFKEDKELLDTLYIGSDKVLDTIQSLESLGQLAGVEIELEPQEFEDGSLTPLNKVALKFTVEANGTWKQVMHLLLLLENAPFKKTISNLTFSTEKTTSFASSTSPGKVGEWKGVFNLTAIKEK